MAIGRFKKGSEYYDIDTSGVYDSSKEQSQAAINQALSNGVDDLKSAITQLDDAIYNIAELPISVKAGGGSINYSTGAVTTSSNWRYTDYISVLGYTKLKYSKVSNKTTAVPSHGLAFYDATLTFIQNSGIQSETNDEEAKYIDATVDIPDEAAYVRFTLFKNLSGAYAKGISGTNDLISNIFALEPITNELTSENQVEGNINASGAITKYNRVSYEIENNGFSAITITANTINVAYVSFLTASTVSLSTGSKVSFCNGETGRHTIEVGKTDTFIVPDDCAIIFVAGVSEGTNYVPQNGYIFGDANIFIDASKKITSSAVDTIALSHSKATVTACVIGSSSENGTTHETASSSAIVDPSKAYLTVALQNNGVVVTNNSHGGMGYVDTASDGTVFKNLVDNLDFGNFDSLYLSLGINDYKGNRPLGTPSDTGTTTACGMLKYALNKVFTDNPYIKVFVIGPRITTLFGDATTQWSWNADNNASTPYSCKNMNDAFKAICDSMFVEYWDNPSKRLVNMYNIETILPDGIHTTQAGMAQWAKITTGLITCK